MLAPDIELLECRIIEDALAGTRLLRLTVPQASGRDKSLDYDFEQAPGLVRLTRADTGEVYEVRRGGCTCRDWKFRRRPVGCKHWLAAALLGWLGEEAQRQARESQRHAREMANHD